MEASGVITGTCLLMCSDGEIAMREREGLLHPLEAVPTESIESFFQGKSPIKSPSKLQMKVDRLRMVKEYSRSAAGRTDMEPSNVRPAPVLKQTMSYLLNNITILESPAWPEIYDFVFDRVRAVRQDMVVQGIMGKDAIVILEQAVRFHAYASYRLRNCGISEFDPVINKQHLLECLKRLLYLYQVTDGPHENQVEFECIYLLDNLGHEETLSHCLSLDGTIRNQPMVRKCFCAGTAVMMKNYARALRLIHGVTSPICLCVVNSHLDKLRISYLQVLSHGYNAKNCQFPIQKLSNLLYAPSPPFVSNLCCLCHLVDWFSTPQATDFVCFSKSKFSWPIESQPCPPLPVLDEMLQPSSLPCVLTQGWMEPRELGSLDSNNSNCVHSENMQWGRMRGIGSIGVETPRGRVREIGSIGVETPRGRVREIGSIGVETLRGRVREIGSIGVETPRGRGRGRRDWDRQKISIERNEDVREVLVQEIVGDRRSERVDKEEGMLCGGVDGVWRDKETRERFEDVHDEDQEKEVCNVRQKSGETIQPGVDEVEERLKRSLLIVDGEKEKENEHDERVGEGECRLGHSEIGVNRLERREGGGCENKKGRGRGRGRSMREIKK